MTAVVVAALLLTAVALAAAAAIWVGSRPSVVVRSRLRQRLVVTLKSGAAFQGLLFQADRSTWVLREVVALGAADRGENVPLDGEVILAVAEIDYCQKP